MTRPFRTAKPPDAAWILDVAREAYGLERITPEAEAWVHEHLKHPSVRCFLGRRSFAFVHIYRAFWEPDPVAWLLFFAARPGGRDLESLALLRHVAAYAKSQNNATLHAGSETGADVGIFMRRIGAKPYELYKLEWPR